MPGTPSSGPSSEGSRLFSSYLSITSQRGTRSWIVAGGRNDNKGEMHVLQQVVQIENWEWYFIAVTLTLQLNIFPRTRGLTFPQTIGDSFPRLGRTTDFPCGE